MSVMCLGRDVSTFGALAARILTSISPLTVRPTGGRGFCYDIVGIHEPDKATGKSQFSFLSSYGMQ